MIDQENNETYVIFETIQMSACEYRITTKCIML